MAAVMEVTEQNWDAEVLNSEKPVLVDFWATWCGPCLKIAPIVEAVAVELADRLKVVKCDTGQAGALATRYGVMSIPALLLFKGGRVVDQIIGAGYPKAQIIQKLEAHL